MYSYVVRKNTSLYTGIHAYASFTLSFLRGMYVQRASVNKYVVVLMCTRYSVVFYSRSSSLYDTMVLACTAPREGCLKFGTAR